MDQTLIACIQEECAGSMFTEPELYAQLEQYAREHELEQTLRVLPYAREKHSGQYRKGKDKIPYYVHPMTLAIHAAALGRGSDEILSACLLHDVCEDCGVAPCDLPVGEQVQTAVALLTKPEDFSHREDENAAYYQAIAGNRIASLVKVLDRCNNVSGMAAGFTDTRIAQYIKETRECTLVLLEQAKKLYPEDEAVYFLLHYHIESILLSLQFMLKRKYL